MQKSSGANTLEDRRKLKNSTKRSAPQMLGEALRRLRGSWKMAQGPKFTMVKTLFFWRETWVGDSGLKDAAVVF